MVSQEPGSPGSLSSAIRIQPCWPRGPRGRTQASFVDGAVIYEVLLWVRTVCAGLALGGRGVQEALPAQPGRLSVPHSPGTLGSHAPGGSELSVHCPLNLAGGEGSRGSLMWEPVGGPASSDCGPRRVTCRTRSVSRLGPWIPADKRRVESGRERGGHPTPPSPASGCCLPTPSEPTSGKLSGGGPRPHKFTRAHPQSAVQDPPCCAWRHLHPPQVLRGLLSAHVPPPGSPPGPSAP